jgi:NTP pyrophosphatase (non-canonical NTP hydrolase)
MTNYVELAVKTESHLTLDQLKARLSRPNMIRLFISLQAMAICGEELDKLKKHIFYGRDLPEDPDIDPSDMEQTPAGQAELNRLLLTVRTLHGVTGIATEAAELIAGYLKWIFGDEALDTVNIGEEVGDLFWYAAILSDEHGFAFEKIMGTNIAKLQRRFPDKFDAARAIDRDTQAERVILDSQLTLEPAEQDRIDLAKRTEPGPLQQSLIARNNTLFGVFPSAQINSSALNAMKDGRFEVNEDRSLDEPTFWEEFNRERA